MALLPLTDPGTCRDISRAAWNYAKALERLEEALAWTSSVRIGSDDLGYRVSLSWAAGSAVAGYETLRKRVEAEVNRMMPKLMFDVYEQLAVEADKARGALQQAERLREGPK